MESCGTCRDFFYSTFSSGTLREFIFGKFLRACSRDEQRSIKESAQDCQLCQMIYHFLKAGYESAFDLPDSDNQSFKIEVFPEKSPLDGEENLLSSVRFYHHVPNSHYTGHRIPLNIGYELAFSIWADEGALSTLKLWARMSSDLCERFLGT